jgi:hypothetical protein
MGDIIELAGDVFRRKQVYTKADIPALEAELAARIVREREWANDPRNDDYPKPPDRSLRHLINLLKSGLAPVRLHQHGFIIDDKFIIAAQKNRWCIKSRMTWYWYKTEQDLAERILPERHGQKYRTDQQWLDDLTRRAVENHDGHLTIMRFTKNWRIGFGTLDGEEHLSHRMAIARMPSGKTFAEAAAKALSCDYVIETPTEDEVEAEYQQIMARGC